MIPAQIELWIEFWRDSRNGVSDGRLPSEKPKILEALKKVTLSFCGLRKAELAGV